MVDSGRKWCFAGAGIGGLEDPKEVWDGGPSWHIFWY